MSSMDIVIPCYRYGRYLRECVESVLTQGVDDLRVLIIDDQSPDETPQVAEALVREDSRVSYVRHQKNAGHIATYNEGIDWLRSDYMLLLSADDYLLPGALKQVMSLLDRHPDMGLCFGEAMARFDSGELSAMAVDISIAAGQSVVMQGEEFISACIGAGSQNIVPTPTAFVRTALLKRTGGYRPDLPHSGDFEMWLRLASCASVGFIKSSLAVYRRHSSNMSLGYSNENIMTDLQQRKAAFDALLERQSALLEGRPRLYPSLLHGLALDALHHASAALNEGNEILSHKLCEYALALDPGIRQSRPWVILACKKLIGRRLSAWLRPAIWKVRTAWTKLREPLRRWYRGMTRRSHEGKTVNAGQSADHAPG